MTLSKTIVFIIQLLLFQHLIMNNTPDGFARMSKNNINQKLLEYSKDRKVEEIKELIEKGADLNTQDDAKWTPLFFSVVYENYELTRYLISRKINVNHRDKLGRTALILGAEKGNLPVVKLLVEQKAELDIQENFNGRTALMIAINERRKDVARYLIDKGANVQLRDEFGITATILAAERSYVELVKMLVHRKADLNAQDADGKTALMHAVIYANAFPTIKYLVDQKADIHLADKEGRTVLMHAALYSRFESVNCLLKNRAIINKPDSKGMTALIHAVSSERYRLREKPLIRVVQLLIKNRAEVNRKDEKGLTGLMHAAKNGLLETVKFLVNADADLKLRDNRGLTAFDIAKVECKNKALYYNRRVARHCQNCTEIIAILAASNNNRE